MPTPNDAKSARQKNICSRRTDPSHHRGAHEYIGVAYLLQGDLPKAKEHLAALDKICLVRCEEYEDLKKEIDAYREHSPSAAPRR